MANGLRLLCWAALATLACLPALQCAPGTFTDENDKPLEARRQDGLDSELLFRFSRAAKGGLFAKYEQRQEKLRQQQLDQLKQDQAQQELAPPAPAPAQVPVSAPAEPQFSHPKGGAVQQQVQQQHQREQKQAQQQQQQQQKGSWESRQSPRAQTFSILTGPVAKTVSTITTSTTTTTTTGGHRNKQQDSPRVARLEEVRVHTIPLSEAIHSSNYVIVPSVGVPARAARLEEASSSSAAASSSSSSSSSQKSSSSSSQSTSTETETVAVAPGPAPPATLVLGPVAAPAPPPLGPDCQVVQRLIIERPLASTVTLKVPSEVSVSSQQSSSSNSQQQQQSSRIVQQQQEQQVAAEPPALVAPILLAPRVQPIGAARLVKTSVAAPANDGFKEEHFHSESRSSREESHGPLSHLASSSSSSSSSSSRSSKSSQTTTTTTTTTGQGAALVVPPPPVVTTTVVKAAPIVHVKSVQPVVAAVKAAPLLAAASIEVPRSNKYSVDVNHHYTSPNVNYGYSIKQQSSEPAPEAKGLLVGERVVYLRK